MDDVGLLPGIACFFLLWVAGCALLLMTRWHRSELHFQLRLFAWAYALRFGLSIAVYQFGLVNVIGDEDGIGWVKGILVMAGWIDKNLSPLQVPLAMTEAFQGHHQGYYYLLAGFFYFTSMPFRLAAAALNGMFGALMVVFAYRIARTLFTEWVARRVAWWTCLFPSMLIWSSVTIKEPVIILLETIALYGCIRLRKGGLSLRHLLLCAFTIVLLIPFRFYAAYIVGLAVVVSLVGPELFRPHRAFPAFLLIGLVVPLVIMSGSAARHEKDFETFSSLDRIQKFRQDVAVGGEKSGAGSGVKSTYDLSTPGGFGLATLVGAAHLMLAPFPWQLGGSSLRMALTLPELLYWWHLFFVGVIPGIRHAIRSRLPDILVILLFILGFGILYSMLFGNVGLIFRQRAQLLPWLFIFGAVGLEQRVLRRLAHRQARPQPPGTALAQAPR